MTTIDREPRRDIVPNGEVPAALPIGIDVIGRAANALILGLVPRKSSRLGQLEDRFRDRGLR